MLYCVNIILHGYYYRLFILNTFHLKHCINEVASRLRTSVNYFYIASFALKYVR